jgi:hypothetical protein
MKTFFKIFCLFFTISASSQVTQIVPLQTIDYTNGTYFKDLNNELSFLVGAWEGVVNNKKYIFEFTLFPQVLKSYKDNSYEYKDELLGKFKVIDLVTNQILYDNINATNYNEYNIFVTHISQGVEFKFLFLDTEFNCNNQVHFSLIKNVSNLNQITYKNFELGEFGVFYNDTFGCPNYQSQLDIPVFLPSVELVLTK